MGKNASKEFSESSVRISIANCELRIANCEREFCRRTFFCVCLAIFAINFSFAQTINQPDYEFLANKINHGTTEQKRDALFQIRNLETPESSRIAVPALLDSSEIVRATATFSVIFLPADEAAQNLLPLLNDKSELVRREAAYALGKTRSLLAVSPLIKKFQQEKIGDVRNACVVAVGEIGDVSAIDFLTRILQKKPKKEDDANEFLRRSAARSVGQIAQIIQTGNSEVFTPQNLLIKTGNNPPKIAARNYKNLAADFPVFGASVSALIQTLQNPNETDDTKRESAFALGAIGDASAVSALQNNLNAADYYLAQICRESLAKISSAALQNRQIQ
ncbi:MAG: HEAT repeat domain-containing protein [Pyrinomonadaceae bacterium]